MRPRLLSDGELLDRALEAFAGNGYEGTSIRALSRHLHVSHNMLRERFGTKEELWYAAVDHGFRHLVDELRSALAEAGDDPLERLGAAMHRFVAVTAGTPALIQILHQESARPGERHQHLLTHYVGPINQAGLDSLRQAQRDGQVRPGPVASVFFHLTTYGLGALTSNPGSLDALGDDVTDPADAATLGIDMILDSLRVQPSARPGPRRQAR